jgi:crotonobetaine/carnitine-CoA ligase
MMGTFSASRFVDQARRHAVTHASLFAAPIRMILNRTASDAGPLALRHAWFAQNLTIEQFANIERLLGCRPRQIYGMTETVPAVLSNPAVGSRPTSLGRPTLGCSVDVLDGTNQPAAAGEEGAIAVGGYPGVTIFAEYLDDAAATAATVVSRDPDGFIVFDTGDRATVDDDGFFSFIGRRSDVLKVAGENVSVVEVESVLAEHPDVDDVAVTGRPDDVRDEVPVAFVVAVDGRGPWPELERSLREFAAARLAPAKRPADYVAVDELPRTSVGKVRRFQLGGNHRFSSNETTSNQQSRGA